MPSIAATSIHDPARCTAQFSVIPYDKRSLERVRGLFTNETRYTIYTNRRLLYFTFTLLQSSLIYTLQPLFSVGVGLLEEVGFKPQQLRHNCKTLEQLSSKADGKRLD